MNKNDFLDMIKDSAPVDRRLVGEIYELTDLFPYFQSAHLLLLKGLQDNADIKFENQLRNSSIYIADREVLYYYLDSGRKKNLVQPPLQGEDSSIRESSANAPSVSASDITDQEADHEQTVIETATSPDPAEDPEQDPEPQPEGIENNYDYLNNEFESDGEELPAENTEVDFSDEEVLTADKSELSDRNDNIIEASEKTDLLELDISEEDNQIPLYDITVEQPVAKENNTRQLQSELIDRFIIANPRIEPVKDKLAAPVEDISQQFTEECGGFVTETLAKIYVSQGYYSKAIDIYEKLSLKFPEKSSYFATQIEKVKEHLKN